MRPRSNPAALALLLAVAVVAAGCGTTKSERRYSKAQAATALARFETIGLEIGEFSIDGDAAVVDGDTVRVKGLKSSMRLIGIDTEETFKKAEERRAFAEGWDVYLKKMKGNSDRPVKMATPLGEDAKHWAQAFFKGVHKVKLERDHPGEIRDFYGRYLAYVLVQKDGKWVNYNVECVRAGMAPYFSKYAYSRRFHKEFVEAQRQARDAKIGIWDPTKQHYPDYDERLAWWNERAEVIAKFEKEMESYDNYFALTRWDSLKKLEKRVGQEVVILGSVAEARIGDGSAPSIVKLARNRQSSFDVVFFDKDVFSSSGVLKMKGEYLRVRGQVRRYKDKASGFEKLQIIVNAPGQVMLPDDKIDELIGNGGRRVEAVPADKNAIKPTGKPSSGNVDLTAPDGKLPEVPNRTVARGRGDGPLDLGDASKAGDLDFSKGGKGKNGPLDLGDASEAGDLDFSAVEGDQPEY